MQEIVIIQALSAAAGAGLMQRERETVRQHTLPQAREAEEGYGAPLLPEACCDCSTWELGLPSFTHRKSLSRS